MSKKLLDQQRALEFMAAAGFVVMWSSGFIGARLGTAQSNSLNVLMWRFLFAAGLLCVVWLVSRRRRLPLRMLLTQAVIGLLAQGLYLYGVFSSVERGVPAGTSCLITALQPIAAAILASPLLKEKTSARQWFGLVIGLVGVALVVASDMRGAGSASLAAYGLSFLAMAGLVAATMIERKTGSDTHLMDALPIQCLATAILFSIITWATDNAAAPSTVDFWFAIGWVVILSTVGGYGFYWFNLRLGSVTRISSLIYLTPPVTMVWAYFMFGDTISIFGLVGLFVCFGSVAVIRSQATGSAPATRAACTS